MGEVDVLVCNAAVNQHFGPLAEISDEAYDKTMNSNVRPNLWLCNMALPVMAKNGGGALIIVSSIAGLKGSRMLGAYALSKAADSQLARNLALEWGSRKITANALAPGIIKTREAGRMGSAIGAQSMRQLAQDAYTDLVLALRGMRANGLSLRAIAARLDAEGHTTRRGRSWTPAQVSRVIARL